MSYLFSAEGRYRLQQFCRPGTLLAIDYDGTLAAITTVPARAHLQPRTRDLLVQVAQRYPVIVLTGRSRQDARQLLGEIPGLEVIGNHGAETEHESLDHLRHQVGEWSAALRARLPVIDGLFVEDKTYSLSVHYRLASDPEIAESVVHLIAAELPGARLIGGKCVTNIVSVTAPDKGDALLTARTRLGEPRTIFVGDDVTDEAVFRLNRPEELLSIRVGQSDESFATHYLRDRDEVDTVLRYLIDA